MDIALVGTLLALIEPATLWIIFQVAIGLGLVIFVHELGHFAVAKWCGVKCDKFYLGFDIYGLKLARFQWGETEYGIGILPLGGYVKMLGQDDNPSAAAAERERSTLASDDPNAAPQLDPRSYMAKSVPQRMAIISAGVIMNLIFCFIVAAIAYGLGVFYMPADFMATVPGSPAWQAGLRSGDRAVSIDGAKHPRYQQDLQVRVMLGSDRPIDFQVRRPGSEQLLSVPVVAAKLPGESRRTIGVVATGSTTVARGVAARTDSAASRAEPALKPGDRIVKVNGQPIDEFYDLQRAMIESPDRPLTVTVARPPAGTEVTISDMVHNTFADKSEEVTIELPPQPIYELGVVMEMGPIVAIQAGSPAAAAGLKADDKLLAIDGQPVGDPLSLAERLRVRAGETVTLQVERNKQPLELQATLRPVSWNDISIGSHAPLSAPALGIAYTTLNRIEEIDPAGPAAHSGEGLRVGDRIVGWETDTPPDPDARPVRKSLFQQLQEAIFGSPAKKPTPLTGDNSVSWSQLNNLLQGQYRAGTKVVLHTEDGRKVEIEPAASEKWFSDERGLMLAPEFRERQATSVGEALALGGRETWENVQQVYLVLRGLTTGRLGADNLGGPVKIAAAAGFSASISFSSLLMFLAMLSANLAVINFLPIPVLDGGHMVFLAAEGIRGKPINERIQMWCTIAGLAGIVLLMLFVLTLDIQWLWNFMQ